MSAGGLVTVCVLNYNQRDLLRETLRNLVAQTTYRPVRIVVADNGSTDGSAAMTAREFPEVELLRFPENLGYPKGINRAFSSYDSPFLAQVNSDALVHHGWLEALTRCLDEHPEAAMAGGQVLFPDGRTQFCGNVFSPTRMALRDWLDDPGERRAEVNFHGPVFLVRQEAWRQVGGFNEGYSPGYGEDAELGADLGVRGWKVLFEPECRATHLVSRTARALGRRRMMRIVEAHRLRFVLRNYPFDWLLVHFALEWAKLLLAATRRYLPQYLAAWSDVWRERALILARRRQLRGFSRWRQVFPPLWGRWQSR